MRTLAVLCALVVGLSITNAGSVRADLIVEEDFDGSGTWVNDHASKLFVDPSSPSEGLFVQAGINLGPDDVLFGRDLQNESGEPDLNPVTVTFDNSDVSSFSSIVFSFDYDLNGFETNDAISYTLSYDSGSDTNAFSGDAAGTESVSVPDGSTFVGLVLTLTQNGGSDSFELDNFQLNGVAVPEPSAFLFGGLVCGVLGVNFARKRMAVSRG